ncbi:MAG: aminotransferase class V-fold PLP-dependent enzyme [Acidobacteria bacterium]|nr:aminotransferase class V-fold PLP-dependent enzyme [Acidobacteriota bacterium]
MNTPKQSPAPTTALTQRKAAVDISPEEFRRLAHRLVDQISDQLAAVPAGPVKPDESHEVVRQAIGGAAPLPEDGAAAEGLLAAATQSLFEHSLFNSHPRFFGYITSGPALIGVLGDFLASAVNPNVGAYKLAPLATEIEAQTVRWLAELIGYPADCGGLLVSGGNMANFVGFLAARRVKAAWNVRQTGMAGNAGGRLRLYASNETHTWVQKATDLFGLGTDSIRWIATDSRQRMDLTALRGQIDSDIADGDQPFLVIGAAGSVSTGAVDPLPEIAAVCREYDLWFHVDGAYGAVAARAPDVPPDLAGLAEADSVAVDPHKWLYAPIEAGCTLVRDPKHLLDTFSYHPLYYHFDKEAINYFDLGPQNSRGFRALKVWLALQQAGRAGYMRMIADDISLAKHFYDLLENYEELEALTQGLSITTFRYIPSDLRDSAEPETTHEYLNQLNQELLDRIEKSGEAFFSNAVIEGKFALRLCVVNFRTTLSDIEALPEIVTRLGLEVDRTLRPR